MVKNKISSASMLIKLQDQEKQFKKNLAKTFLEYLDILPANKRIQQIESMLGAKNLPTLDRRLTVQEKKCLHLTSLGKDIKETAAILRLSQRTIKYHRANIIKKLNTKNIITAIVSWIHDKDIFDYDYSASIYWETFFTKIDLVNLLPISVFWKNKHGIYLGCNINFAKALDFDSIKKILGKTDDDLPTSDLSDHYRKDDQEVIALGKPKLNIEDEQNFPDGRKIFILTNKVLIFRNDEPVGVLGSYNDISILKKIR